MVLPSTLIITIASLATLASFPFTTTTSAATLIQNAPSASTLGGAHILLDNDVDSNTPKYPMILLSKPRSYKDSQDACSSLGEDLVQSSGYGNIPDLLNDTPVAQSEIKGIHRVWVNSNDNSKCTALDRKDGSVVQLSCTTKLPALCKNSVARTILGRTNDKSKQVQVKTPRVGVYQGYRDQDSFRFLGIPYAQAPVGNLRFVGPKKWTLANRMNKTGSVMDSTEFGFACMQFPDSEGNNPMNKTESIQMLGNEQSEDCLHLNVFTPSLQTNNNKNAQGLPVMVYVHGGSYTSYAGSSPMYQPGNLVSRGGVVVVTLNYRLALFGLFENAPDISRSKVPGNQAVHDQIAALRWVQDNIASFGGNPDLVTIFGESAGGWSMRALLSAPSAFGLYKNVLSQSDPMGLPFTSPKVASGAIGAELMKILGCKGSDLVCAQSKTVDEIQRAQIKATNAVLAQAEYNWPMLGNLLLPNADGDFIPADLPELIRTGRYNTKANLMWGSTRDEYGLFVPPYYPDPVPVSNATAAFGLMFQETNRTSKLISEPSSPYKFNTSDDDTVRDIFTKSATDFYFGCPVQMLSRGMVAKTKGEAKVYVYIMDHGRDANGALSGEYEPFCKNRVCHADDILPNFGSGDIVEGSVQTGEDARFSRQVIDRFTVFARTGNPNPAVKGSSKVSNGAAGSNQDLLQVQWPTFGEEHQVFHFDLTSSVKKNADTKKCNWIAENVQYDYQVHAPDGKYVPIYPPIA